MPFAPKTHLRAVACDLRRVGIPARVSPTNDAVLLLPTLGGEGVAALRLLHPALQNVRIRTSLYPKAKAPQPPKK